MIFVTVGTTDFDQLVVQADQLAASLEEEMVIQIGHGRYQPQHAGWFRFEPSLEPYLAAADLVITHGGYGTLVEVLRHGLRAVGVSNPDRYDKHQDQILQVFAEEGRLIWCRDLADLPAAVEQARRADFAPYRPPECRIPQVIDQFIESMA